MNGNESGQGLIEYALIMVGAVIMVGAIVAIIGAAAPELGEILPNLLGLGL